MHEFPSIDANRPLAAPYISVNCPDTSVLRLPYCGDWEKGFFQSLCTNASSDLNKVCIFGTAFWVRAQRCENPRHVITTLTQTLCTLLLNHLWIEGAYSHKGCGLACARVDLIIAIKSSYEGRYSTILENHATSRTRGFEWSSNMYCWRWLICSLSIVLTYLSPPSAPCGKSLPSGASLLPYSLLYTYLQQTLCTQESCW